VKPPRGLQGNRRHQQNASNTIGVIARLDRAIQLSWATRLDAPLEFTPDLIGGGA
jgi:hypothetical protein